ncbi:MAG: lipopolysaccharide transport periplasmic protein LptA [Alphaproteobacteria bacterium]|nr:MAG: lipopolysaccharide transport periplasmic protein LptA [Alphaproteobacteria bacterium]
MTLGLAVLAAALPAAAQTANSPFASFKHDSTLPIEVTSESLSVNQTRKIATFSGKVVAGQGTLRLTAAKIEIHYDADASQSDSQTGRIRLMKATGGVFLSNGSEAAEGQWAEYDVIKGIITMGGNVLLTQGENAISGQSLWIDLNAGIGKIEGRVKTVFQPARKDGGN